MNPFIHIIFYRILNDELQTTVIERNEVEFLLPYAFCKLMIDGTPDCRCCTVEWKVEEIEELSEINLITCTP